MNNHEPNRDTAKPAEESLKKHGDQLEKPVEEAAGKRQPDGDDRGQGERNANASRT